MKTCICHNISHHTVTSVLGDLFKGITIITKRRGDAPDSTQQPPNLDDLHESCSGGAGFNCGKCACAMADLAREHNRGITMSQLKDSLPVPTGPATVKPGQKAEPAL